MGNFRILLKWPYNFLAIFFIGIAIVYFVFTIWLNPPKIAYTPHPTVTVTPSVTPTDRPTPVPTKMPKSVVFLGGSITLGARSSKYENSWTSILSHAIERNYPGYSWSFINAGVGGTPSWYGLVRLQTDVLDHDPDIIFIDFAVNDSVDTSYPAPENTGFGPAAEALLRRIRNALPNAQIYAWIFSWPDSYSFMNARTRASRDKWISLAQHYNLMLLRFDEAIKQDVGSNELTDQQIDKYLWEHGDVHPNDLGHSLAAKYAEEHLVSMNPAEWKPINEYSYLFTESIDYERSPKIIEGGSLNHSEGWMVDSEAIDSNLPGAEITYIGDFCSFGVDSNVGEGAGKVSWSIDGKEQGILDFSTSGVRNRPVAAVICGEHTLTFRVIEGTIRIYRLLII